MTLGSGSAYAISFAFTPFITRIYEPDAYGAFAIFNALTINLATMATLGYEQAVIIPKYRKDYYGMIRLNFIILTIFCLLLVLLISFVDLRMLTYFNMEVLAEWLYLLPLFIFIHVAGQLFTTISVRASQFKAISFSRTASVMSAKTYALVYGLSVSGKLGGFIVAELIGKGVLTGGILLKKVVLRNVILAFKSRTSIKQVAKDFKNYPRYTLPAICLTTISAQLPLYALAKYYNTDDVGYFSIAAMLLTIPMTLVGRSMETVFLQRATELHNQGKIGQIKALTNKILKKIFTFGSFPLLFVVIFGVQIFELIFGSEWATSGVYARYIAIYVLVELASFPISSLYRVLRYERNFLMQSIISFIIIFSFLFIGAQFQRAEWMVLMFAIGKLLESGIKLGVIYRKLNQEAKKER